jgi:transcriptional regulator
MKLFITVVSFLIFSNAIAQKKLFTKTANISFFSKTNVENIQATNKKGLCVWEQASGNIELSVLMKGFEFAKALMQEHFNESYVESDKFPKATFKGVIENSNAINLTANNVFNATVTGMLTMHGVTKQITTPIQIKVLNGIISVTASFNVLLADFNIKVPSLVADNINKKIQISINIPALSSL